MPGIYGGDEVSAIVVDYGSSSLRFGWAGEDTPRGIIPTQFGYTADDAEGDKDLAEAATKGDDAMEGVEENESNEVAEEGKAAGEHDKPKRLAAQRQKWKTRIYSEKRKRYLGDAGANMYRPSMDVGSSVNDEGIVSSIPSVYAQTQWAMRNTLQADPTEHPLMITEPSWIGKESREELTELAFEGLQSPAFYLANSTVLSAFAAGKPTALVIDVGENGMSAIPVVDGFILRKGIHRQSVGGLAVSKALLYSITNASKQSRDTKIDIVPQYLVQSKVAVEAGRPAQAKLREDRLSGATASFKAHHTMKVVHDFKEACAQVLESPWEEGLAAQRMPKSYEFPDGFNDSFGIERLRGPEILFTPSMWQGVEEVLPSSAGNNLVGSADLAVQAVNSVDVDSRAALWANVVCVGGSALLPGFTDRLSYELSIKAPGQKIKLHAPGNTIERKYSSWIGGSILASLGTFHQLWISKEEWEEHGNAIVHARCK